MKRNGSSLGRVADMVRLGLKGGILKRGFKQREISRAILIPENRLSSIVNGWTDPTADERRKLAALLRLTEHELFDEGSSIEIRSA
jgi:transcriptional regulator with XRE-family HTH domain